MIINNEGPEANSPVLVTVSITLKEPRHVQQASFVARSFLIREDELKTEQQIDEREDEPVREDQQVVFIGCLLWTLIQTMRSHELRLFFGDNLWNTSFTMISIWFLYFWTILDQEN